MRRVIAFVDGFNLYHAIKNLRQDHLRWLDLRTLCGQLVPAGSELTRVYYFSAFATWLPNAYRRHREYVAALEAVGVVPIMGRFKEKDRECKVCHAHYPFHEEKETDVNIAIHLLRSAMQDEFDLALLVSNDSDLAPAVRMVTEVFPQKEIWSVAPPGRRHTQDLVQAVGNARRLRTIWPNRLEKCLFGAEVRDASGLVRAARPSKYDPP